MGLAAILVRSTRKSRKLSQRDLSVRADLPQSRVSLTENARESPRFDTVSRLLAGAGHRLFAAPTTRDDVATLASRIRASIAADDGDAAAAAFLELNANLVAERGLVRGVLAITEPELIGTKTWDAAVAALVAYRLTEESVPLPAWVHDDGRRLGRARVLHLAGPDVPGTASVPEDVPREFLERGVLLGRAVLDGVPQDAPSADQPAGSAGAPRSS